MKKFLTEKQKLELPGQRTRPQRRAGGRTGWEREDETGSLPEPGHRWVWAVTGLPARWSAGAEPRSEQALW